MEVGGMEMGVRRWLVNISTWDPSEERFASLSSLLPPHERPAITRYWCLKESFVKAIGAGLGFGLHRLEFHHTRWRNIYVCIDGAESKDWRFWLFELDERHLASIAKGHPREAVETYRQTMMEVDFEGEEFQCTLQLPEHGFTSFTVDQLVPKENK